MLQVRVSDRVSWVGRSRQGVFVSVHKDVDSKRHINIHMVVHKHRQTWYVRNNHPVFLHASAVNNPSIFIYRCSLLERLRETIQTLPVFIAVVGLVRMLIATVHIIHQNMLFRRRILFGLKPFNFDDSVNHLKG